MNRLGSAALASLMGAARAAAAQDTITVYTSQPNEQMADVVEAFNAEHPEIEVEVFRSGTTEVMSKLMAEITAGIYACGCCPDRRRRRDDAVEERGPVDGLSGCAGSGHPCQR